MLKQPSPSNAATKNETVQAAAASSKLQGLLLLLVLGGFALALYNADGTLGGVAATEWQAKAHVLRESVIVAWAVSLADILLLRGGLGQLLGLRPRRLQGLLGIVFAPLLHRDLAHLVANTVPFMVLGWLVLIQDALPNGTAFYGVSATILLVGGLATWLLGRAAIHVGASGLIFGYIGFLLVSGYAGPTLLTVGIAAVVLVMYGRQLWGMMPTFLRKGGAGQRVSWEGHLFGFVGGVAAGLRPDWLGAVMARFEQMAQWLIQ
ncbi:MAG: rhomboid family intramembrane serine protease [Cyanobacteria bacterium J06598_3]